MNVNKIFLGGRLTKDPEKRFANNGMAVVTFSVAVNRKTKAAGDREARDEVTFVEVTGFGKTAEPIAEYLKKGDPIFLEGRLRLESWQDKATGAARSKLSVVMDSFQFVGANGEAGAGDEPPPGTARKRTAPEPAAKQGNLPGTVAAEEQDDVPF